MQSKVEATMPMDHWQLLARQTLNPKHASCLPCCRHRATGFRFSLSDYDQGVCADCIGNLVYAIFSKLEVAEEKPGKIILGPKYLSIVFWGFLNNICIV